LNICTKKYYTSIANQHIASHTRNKCFMINRISFFLFFILNLFVGVSNANFRKGKDSMVKILQSSSDKDKPGILNSASKANITTNPSKSVIYGREAIFLSTQLKDDKNLAEAYLNTGAGYYNLYNYDSANYFYIKSLDKFKKLKNNISSANVLNNIGLVFKDLNKYSEALDYHQKAYQYYNKANNNKGMAISLNYTGNVYLKEGQFNTAIENYLKALEIREKAGLTNEVIGSLNNIGTVYRDINNFNEAIEYYQNALEKAHSANNTNLEASTLNFIGGTYWKMKRYDMAMENYLKSLDLRMKADEPVDIASSYQNIGILYKDLGNYKKALEYFIHALDLYKKIGEKKKTSVLLNFIGNTYSASGDQAKALDYHLQSLKLKNEIGDQKDVALSLNNIGTAYCDLGNNPKGFECYNQALAISTKIADKPGIITACNNLGNYYIKVHDENSALKALNNASFWASEISDQYNLALCSRKIGEIYFNKSNINKAEPYIAKSLEIGKKINNKELIRKAYYALYQLHSKIGDKSALKDYIEYAAANDSVLSEQNITRIVEAQMNFEVERKEKEISKIMIEREQEEKIHSLQTARQKILIYLLLVILALLIVMGMNFYSRYKYKKKTESELKKSLLLIEESNQKLTKSEIDLKKLVATKDKFFSIMAHDIKNPLGGLINLTELLNLKFEELSDKEVKEITEILNTTSKGLYSLLENLLEWSRSQTGRIKYNPEEFDIYELIKKIESIFSLNAEKKEIIISTEVKPNTTVYGDKEMISTVLRNLISNAIKFTKPNGNVTIKVADGQKEFLVSVKDTGIGISDEDKDKLFKPEVNFTTSGTQQETGTGLGLILCKEFVEKNCGKIWVESLPGEGSEFMFTLPKYN
jgi:signal transduction histidine kinase/Tfp pilus assembly protein PilF